MMKHDIEEFIKKYNITEITDDSRLSDLNYAYFARKGYKYDGAGFINDAISRGCKLIFTESLNAENRLLANTKAHIYKVDDIHKAMKIACDIIYPEKVKKLIAITGTNGKTSVSHYTYFLLSKLGVKSAVLGTNGLVAPEEVLNNLSDRLKILLQKGLTTFDQITFRKIMHELSKQNIDALVFEASSIGIEERRMEGIKADHAAFTSFSQDHLDYHKNIETYLNSKLKLFSNHLKDNASVILPYNLGVKKDVSDYARSILEKHNISPETILDQTLEGKTYYLIGEKGDGKCAIEIENYQIIFDNDNNSIKCSSSFIYKSENKQNNLTEEKLIFETNIIGKFQTYNLLMAAKLAFDCAKNFTKISFNELISLIEQVPPVKGRMQMVYANDKNTNVYVDFAHAPDALEKTLLELTFVREQIKKSQPCDLIIIFGCGGDRDRQKRPLMGKIAVSFADKVIITDDNPRCENPQQIRQDILKGISSMNHTSQITEIYPREKAITSAISSARSSDIIVIAGKGHEDYQIIGTQKHYFSDYEIAKNVLEKIS